METKSLLYGLIGFFIGGLIVSIAATQFDKGETSHSSMQQMTDDLTNKTGDDFDKAYMTHMIAHHQAAVDMAKLSAERANHQEIKDLSLAIIATQEKEIATMKQWQAAWGYDASTKGHLHN
jgi:uncharacterized protein (DUF305 family)